jgi:hypothetical protein
MKNQKVLIQKLIKEKLLNQNLIQIKESLLTKSEETNEIESKETIDKISITRIMKTESHRINTQELKSINNRWENFRRVVIDSRESQYVICNCETIIKYNRLIGTNGLKRHKCSRSPNQPSIESYFIKKLSINEMKSKIADSAAIMCAKDLRPFSFVEKDGFLQLAQQLLNIGQQYGKVDVRDVIPNVFLFDKI